MGVVIGDSEHTLFSYVEYQALMFALAGFICLGIFVVEMSMTRFQVLPLLFPGLFSIRERRFFFFSFDISDGHLGKKIRGEAKMVCRITLCVVLSYMWQMCVLETTQSVGNEFPDKECNEMGWDCFASELHYSTLVTRRYTSIDCEAPGDFEKRMVVSCVRFVKPSATLWLMHLAIAHSVTHLNFRTYELLVWICGHSVWMRRVLGAAIFLSFAVIVSLLFSGVVWEFNSSWLSFVMSLSVPIFLHSVWKAGKALESLLAEEFTKVQKSIEMQLNDAFSDIEAEVAQERVGDLDGHVSGDNQGGDGDDSTCSRKGGFRSNLGAARKFLNVRRQGVLNRWNTKEKLCGKDACAKEDDTSPRLPAGQSAPSAGSHERIQFTPVVVGNDSQEVQPNPEETMCTL